MRESFLEYADRLINQINPEDVYKDLIEIFDDNCLFHEEGACNEKLWHITHEPELYKRVGDIFANKVGNFDVAFNAYNRYIQYSDFDFFKNYARVTKKLGYLNIESDNEDYSKEIIKICDSYDTIVFMMVCSAQNKDYETVLELDKKLTESANKIQGFLKEHRECNAEDYIRDNEASKQHLSQILSEIPHHNDINNLAIKYDNQNKKAYINIIGDFITYKNYNDAIMFYNYTYCDVFSCPRTNDIVDICWHISDYYRDIFDFYNAVLFQKFALELDTDEV